MEAPKKTHGRRPADQAGDPRQSMWMAIKALQGKFTVVDITTATRINRSTVYDYLRGLRAGGWLSFEEAPSGQPGLWLLVKDAGYHAPRVSREGKLSTAGQTNEQMWRVICSLRDFDFRDLIENSSIEIPEATAKDYCHRLLVAGYFKVLTKANPARGQIARYRLIRNSGPRPPQIQRIKRVYDPNTGEVYDAESRA